MKNLKLPLLICILSIITAGCGIKKMVKNYPDLSIKLENQELENKGGKVDYTIKGSVPPKYLQKKATVEIEVPYLVYDTETGQTVTKSLEKITLVGEKSKNSGTTIPYKSGGTFTKTGSFDYDEAYQNADIDAVANISKGKQNQKMGVRKLGDGIKDPSSLIRLYPTVTSADLNGNVSGNGTLLINGSHQYKPEFITETATIYFEVNLWNINWNLKLNKDKAAKDQIKAFVDFLYEGRVIDKVVVYGWASPEGEESRNEGLSEKRFEQGKKWFNEQFEKYLRDYAKKNKIKYKDVNRPEIVFENHAPGEDWSGFEIAVENSNIAEKNQILNVVRSQPSSALREQKIREMTDIYNEIKDAILPPLRRSEISLICNKNKYNDKEILELVFSDPKVLSLNERLYAASLTNDDQQKEAIYLAIINDESTQQDWRAYNNLAVLKLNDYLHNKDNADLNEGTNYLNKARATSPNNGIILNNVAVETYLKGDVKGAKTVFQDAQNAALFPVKQSYNLGVYQILDGNYDNAQQMMNDKHCDYNMALTYMIKKNHIKAKETLECIQNPDSDVRYLMAVLSVRMKNYDEAIGHLRVAVSEKPEHAKKAKNDPEFKELRERVDFKEIVK